jgi:hypothetical protein
VADLFDPGVVHFAAFNGLLPPPGQSFEIVAPEDVRPDYGGADARLQGIPFKPLESLIKLIEFMDRLQAVVDAQA